MFKITCKSTDKKQFYRHRKNQTAFTMKFGTVCSIITVLALAPRTRAKVTLVNNGYEGVTVYIAAAVREDHTLIEEIQNLFSDASDRLFLATKNRAFFRNILIVIPKSWNYPESVKTIPPVNTFDGYIRIDKPNGKHQNRPYVRGNLECGKPAWYMHLTPEFVKGNHFDKYGPPAKSVVHEWGHLRWGLFDEYPSVKFKSTYPYSVNFYNGGGRWNPVTCSKQVTGSAYQGNCDVTKPCSLDNLTLDPKCKFCANTAQVATASLMGSQWINSIEHFCEADDPTTPAAVRHDSTAPNLQNKMCNGRSAWEVILEHEDFRDGNNPAISIEGKTPPVFQIVRESSKVRVFVYDVSGSMQSNNKIIKQAEASYVVMNNVVETGSYIGIVQFNALAHVLAELTEVTNVQVREELKNLVPRVADGGTQIFYGVSKAIEVIENGTSSTEGAEIVLLSDGMSNSPYMHINQTLVNKGIIVHTIAITNEADTQMAELADITGGRSYTYLETDSVSFADVLTQAVSTNAQSGTAAHKILGATFTVRRSMPISGVFYIDDGLGNETTLTVIQSSSYTLTVTIEGPDGLQNNTQGVGSIMTLTIPGTVPVGEYNYSVTTASSTNISVEITVSSSPTAEDVDVIQVTSYVNSSTIDFSAQSAVQLVSVLQKGQEPVLNATVTAVLAADSTYIPRNLVLQDSGTGADAIYGDGIYSTYLLKSYFTVKGSYNMKINIEANGGAYIENFMSSGADSIPGTVNDTNVTTTNVGNFTRESIPGEITVLNFVSNPTDTIPPAQIADFRVENIATEILNGAQSLTYTFAWTAVGSDMDIGQATSYDMRLNSDIQVLRNDFLNSGSVPAILPSPQQSGLAETVMVTFTHAHCIGICYVAVTAKDENDLAGDISNIVNVDIDFSYVVSDVPVREDSTKDSILLLLIVSISASLVALMILLFLVYKYIYRYHKASRKVDSKPETECTFGHGRDQARLAFDGAQIKIQNWYPDVAVFEAGRYDNDSRPRATHTKSDEVGGEDIGSCERDQIHSFVAVQIPNFHANLSDQPTWSSS